jgi:hypothetical protein
LPAKALASEPGFFSRELSVRRSQIGEDLSKAEMKFIVVESLRDFFWKVTRFPDKTAFGNRWRHTRKGRRQQGENPIDEISKLTAEVSRPCGLKPFFREVPSSAERMWRSR